VFGFGCWVLGCFVDWYGSRVSWCTADWSDELPDLSVTKPYCHTLSPQRETASAEPFAFNPLPQNHTS